MKVAPKPETTSYPVEWDAPTYAELVRHEKSCAKKLAKRIKEAEHAKKGSERAWKNKFG